jgi:hypothetical protein
VVSIGTTGPTSITQKIINYLSHMVEPTYTLYITIRVTVEFNAFARAILLEDGIRP